MALTSLDGLIAAPKLLLNYIKTATMGTATAGTMQSLWLATGGSPGPGAAPGNTTTGLVPTQATAGAMAYAEPASGQWYIMSAGAIANAATTVFFWDRAWHAGAFTGTNGTYAGYTGATTPTRLDTGEGFEVWTEIQTAFSAQAHTLTITYTNQDGTTGRTGTVSMPASAPAQRMYPAILATGDRGVRAITGLSGSANNTGTFNVLMLRRLVVLPVPATLAVSYDLSQTGLQEVWPSSCIMASVFQQSTTGLVVQSGLTMAAG